MMFFLSKLNVKRRNTLLKYIINVYLMKSLIYTLENWYKRYEPKRGNVLLIEEFFKRTPSVLC